ncbi:hypothetical protein [Shewanella benthica]|uniref:hypothetical protein n=1 Tax=Shewanella benthica TaxID=43661 RepID=UPI001E5AF014|nr:hypothetical protein [Shewanella benthica]
MLLCQFLAIGSAFSVQYPSGEHPMGIDVSHHHSHVDSSNSYSSSKQVSHRHAPLAFNATEPVASAFESNELAILDGASTVSAEAEHEHEHANHSHTQSHPPAEPIIISSFFQSEILTDDDISYLNCRHAPPIPPPHT